MWGEYPHHHKSWEILGNLRQSLQSYGGGTPIIKNPMGRVPSSSKVLGNPRQSPQSYPPYEGTVIKNDLFYIRILRWDNCVLRQRIRADRGRDRTELSIFGCHTMEKQISHRKNNLLKAKLIFPMKDWFIQWKNKLFHWKHRIFTRNFIFPLKKTPMKNPFLHWKIRFQGENQILSMEKSFFGTNIGENSKITVC